MIKAIIIDDEKKAAENLCMLLKEFCPEITVTSVAYSGSEGIERIKTDSPDIIFLDIQMPKMSGFDMLTHVPNPNFEIVFTTAHNEFAVQAFRVNAIDYLLKPILVDELRKAVKKCIQRIETKTTNAESIFKLISKMQNPGKSKFVISNLDGINFIDNAQVLYLVADSNYTHVHLIGGKKHTISKTLKDVEESLTPNIFFRIHIGTIVNLSHVIKYIRGDGGAVIMSDGTTLEVAKRRKHELLDKLL